MTRHDLPLKVQWYNDPEVRKTLIIDELFELEKTRQWFEAVRDSQSRLDLIIETPEGVPIGITGFVNIDREYQSAEIFIVIGRKDYWAKGIMLEAHKLLIEWGFKNLPITRIVGITRIENIGSIVTLKKLGFQRKRPDDKNGIKDDHKHTSCEYILEKSAYRRHLTAL